MPKVTKAHLEARRQQILDAAWACFARKGYHQTTMQDICQESGLSPGAIYRYFVSKDALLKASVERSLEMNRDLLEAARSQAEGPLDALELLGEAMFSRFNDLDFDTWTRLDIETRPEFLRNEVLRQGIKKQLDFWRTALIQLMAEARQKGQLRAQVDPQAMAVLLVSLWEGMRQFNLFDRENFRPDTCIDLMRSLVLQDRSPEARRRRKTLPPLGTRLRQHRRDSRKKEATDRDVRVPR